MSTTSSSTSSSSHIFKYFNRKKKNGAESSNSSVASPNSLTAPSSGAGTKTPSPPTTAPPVLRQDACSFVVGVSEDRNRKCRRNMEDAHTAIYNFGEVVDSGYFAIFDGHAGHSCAEYCSKRLHVLLDAWIKSNDREFHKQQKEFGINSNKVRTDLTPAHALSSAFLEIDSQVGKMNMNNSGTTAAVAVVRWEDQPVEERQQKDKLLSASSSTSLSSLLSPASRTHSSSSLLASSPNSSSSNKLSKLARPSMKTTSSSSSSSASLSSLVKNRRRMLYVANVGDSRVVLCRAGKAYRLTYDHKGSDARESQRVVNCGGIMMNHRVNGILAVTRSLGDTYMKDLVTGAPYTTETQLKKEDEFLIIACDGLWDVCSDSTAVNLIRDIKDPREASQILVDHALEKFSTDNLTVMVVRLDQTVFDPKRKKSTVDDISSVNTTVSIPTTGRTSAELSTVDLPVIDDIPEENGNADEENINTIKDNTPNGDSKLLLNDIIQTETVIESH